MPTRLIPLMRRDLLVAFRLLGERGRRAYANLTRPRAVRQALSRAMQTL